MPARDDQWWEEWLGPLLERARQRPYTALYGFEEYGRHGPLPRCSECGTNAVLRVVSYGEYRCQDQRDCERLLKYRKPSRQGRSDPWKSK